MENNPDESVKTPYGKKAFIFAVLATILFISSAALTVYGIVCPSSARICFPDSINAILSGVATFLLTAGVLAGIAGILFAVESIAAMEKTSKPYIALAILLVSAIGVSGNVFQFCIRKVVGMIFHRGY